ncbi:hypothetical protein N7488_003335 [Penicillium malachiteum]|nr:hypothetical protein N7488_003335 [Penicillium malachiteum]
MASQTASEDIPGHNGIRDPLKVEENAPIPPAAPGPPPDGGTVAWLQVAAGFMLFFNTWGMINTFGVFQTYYESGEVFTASSSDISWIGSIQCFLLQLMGCFMVVFELMMLSLCKEFWQALLAQAFCLTYRSRRRYSLVESSLSGLIYPIVLYRLIFNNKIGFPWAVRTIGFIALATFILPALVMRVRVRAPKPRAVIDWAAFTDGPYIVFSLGLLILFIGNAILIFYISFYSQNKGFADTELSFYLVAVFNAASILGRIAPNALSDRIGVFNTIAPVSLLLGVTVLCLLGVVNKAGMIVEAIVTGFFSGVVVALPPVCFRMLTENKAMIGTCVGQGFAIGGFGLLIGGPSGGAILGSGDDWTAIWVYGGVAACVAGLIMMIVRVMKAGFKPVKV